MKSAHLSRGPLKVKKHVNYNNLYIDSMCTKYTCHLNQCILLLLLLFNVTQFNNVLLKLSQTKGQLVVWTLYMTFFKSITLFYGLNNSA